MADSATGSLLAQAAQSRRLEGIIQTWPSLRGVSFNVGPIKGDKLKIFVSTPAAITRLRQSLPSLVNFLQTSGVHINQIQLQIQTNPLPSKHFNSRPKRALFSDAAKKAWLELEPKLTDSPILEATKALYRHHKLK